MQKQYFLAIAAVLALGGLLMPQGREAGRLTVSIVGLKNDKGDVKIGLFNSEASFNGKEKKLKGAIVKPENQKATWEIADLPFGEYAVKAFHDEDQDDEIDAKFGIPSEGFGFSNNPSVLFGAPNYEKAKFIFNSDSMKIEIKLKNF